MKQPLKENYTTPFNDKFVMFDSKKYAKDMDKYVDYMHSEVKSISTEMRDILVSLGQNNKQYSPLCQIADKLYSYSIK